MVRKVTEAYEEFLSGRISKDEYRKVYGMFVDTLNPVFRGPKLTQEDCEATFGAPVMKGEIRCA